jgi:hypothetical protein
MRMDVGMERVGRFGVDNAALPQRRGPHLMPGGMGHADLRQHLSGLRKVRAVDRPHPDFVAWPDRPGGSGNAAITGQRIDNAVAQPVSGAPDNECAAENSAVAQLDRRLHETVANGTVIAAVLGASTAGQQNPSRAMPKLSFILLSLDGSRFGAKREVPASPIIKKF